MEALKKTNLEEPMIFRIHRRLCEKGILKEEGIIPGSIEELEQQIDRIVIK